MTLLSSCHYITLNSSPNKISEYLLKKELPEANFERNGRRNVIVKFNNFISEKITGVKNYAIDISYSGKVKKVNYRKVSSEIHRLVLKSNKNEKEWLEQEKINLLSSEINKMIDKACVKYNINISENEKNTSLKKYVPA